MLLAVIDLMRMRQFDGEEQPPLSAATLTGQKGRLPRARSLHLSPGRPCLLHREGQCQSRALLPDRAQQPASVPLAFSARMLRAWRWRVAMARRVTGRG
jgi:hypothetical protein